ncbi:MAG: LysM peptidoglycan-binding domain-containing protein [Pasteurellaceae bacterium]|nr:LysM peptidoglycan-binding domain-containing protein [Pasteurellaceae bacterium]
MKKFIFVLPAMAMMLTACTTNNDMNQPAAEVTTAGIPSWQSPDLQPIPMPSTMGQPSYQPIPQPNYQPMPQPSYQAPQPMATPSERIGQCQILRDMYGKPLYAQMQKGCYRDATYTVGKSDTLFFVAFLAGKLPEEIAILNHLSPTSPLKIGQQLRLK